MNNKTLKIIKCASEDLERLQLISIETFKESFGSMNSESNMKKYLNSAFNITKLEMELNDNNAEFYFLYKKEVLVGYMKINEFESQTEFIDEHYLELERIYIRKLYQGKKYGNLLIEKVFEIAKSKNKKTLWLGVWEHNLRAIKFYKKLGFKPFSQHSFYLGDDKQTDILMKQEL